LCGRAHEHATAALRLRPHDAGLQFMLGQVLLTLRQLGAATEAFENARRSGIDARHCAPFLAEIAFRQQRYSEIAAQFSVGRSFHHRPRNVAAFWERASHGAVER
jgi:predicted Zn-dependent protease